MPTVPKIAILSPNTVTGGCVNTNTKNYTFWSAPLQIITKKAWLKGIRFRIRGSATLNSLTNIRLFVDGVSTGKTGIITLVEESHYIVINFTTSPITLYPGNHIISVVADVQTGSGEKVQLSLQEDADITITRVGSRRIAEVAGEIPNNAVPISINVGSVSVVVDPTLQVATKSGITKTIIAKFKLRAYGENITIEDIIIEPVLTETCNGLKNVTLHFNGLQVGAPQEWPITGGYLRYTLDPKPIILFGLGPNDCVWLEVKADLGDNLQGNVSANLITGKSNAQGQNSLAKLDFPFSKAIGTILPIQKFRC